MWLIEKKKYRNKDSHCNEWLGWYEGQTIEEAFGRYMYENNTSLRDIFEYFKSILEEENDYPIYDVDFGHYKKDYNFYGPDDLEEEEKMRIAKHLGEMKYYA